MAGPLKDDETRMVPYDKLSRGRKQQLDLDRRKAVKDAEAEKNVPFGNKAANALTQLHPFLPKRMKEESQQSLDADAARRADRLKNAQSEAAYEDTKGSRKLFSDDAIHKLDPDARFAKGGMVRRGYGAARKRK